MRTRIRYVMRQLGILGAAVLPVLALDGGAARSFAAVTPGPASTPAAAAPPRIEDISRQLFGGGKIVGLAVGVVDHGQQRALFLGEVAKGSGRSPDARRSSTSVR